MISQSGNGKRMSVSIVNSISICGQSITLHTALTSSLSEMHILSGSCYFIL
jgi:hypothetical protein